MRTRYEYRSKFLLAATALGALIAASPALAQPAASQPPSPPATADTPGSGVTVNPRDTSGVADIIVTANRRAERNQTVPISITAFSQQRLEQQNITSNQDLQASVPSLSVTGVGTGSRESQSFALRGQGTTFQASPGVVAYFNEVPLPQGLSTSQQGGPGNYVDLENLQVLAGPQGTLFGRNTTGGAVLLVPKKPTNDFGGYVQGTVGNYSDRQVEGVLNVPIIPDKLMIRAVGSFQDRDGYTRDVVYNKDRDNVHYYAGRLGILARPTERLENYTLIYGVRSQNNGAGNIHIQYNYAALAAYGFCADRNNCTPYSTADAIAKNLGPRKTALDVNEFQNTTNWGIENTTKYELNDNLAVRNIFAYQRLKIGFLVDGDATPLQQYDTGVGKLPNGPVTVTDGTNTLGPITYNNQGALFPRDNLRVITEELQLQGTALDRHLTYTVGGFYYDQKPVGEQGYSSINFCPAAYTGNPDICTPVTLRQYVKSRSKALYAQATLDLGAVTPALEHVRLTGGYRYTWDSISGFYNRFKVGTATNGLGAGNSQCSDNFIPGTPTKIITTDSRDCTQSGSLKSKAPNWTIGLDYQVNSRVLVFAKASRGYKSGGFNSFAVRPEYTTFKPEIVTTYEGGFKTDFKVAGLPTRLNATYYYTNYSNIQRTAGDINNDTGAQGAKVAAAKARLHGIEAELTLKPFRQLELGGNFSYNKGHYTQYDAVTDRFGVCPTPGALYKCQPFPFLPEVIYSIHAAVNVPAPFELGGDVAFFVNYSHTGSQHTEPLELPPTQPGEKLGAYGLLNASIDWNNIAQSGMDAGLFVTNATNRLYQISNSNGFNTLLTQSVLYGEPRMFGFRLRYHFGS